MSTRPKWWCDYDPTLSFIPGTGLVLEYSSREGRDNYPPMPSVPKYYTNHGNDMGFHFPCLPRYPDTPYIVTDSLLNASYAEVKPARPQLWAPPSSGTFVQLRATLVQYT